ncbi:MULTISPECIES: M1 family metallopeptidase [unclassified Duganella]|jgi:leukotriene-A4 hydrolase|uniref:M1 family metallopeptidase n=1 Tax=unclassified Duganella TaxID=2636909 RepID=UPI00088CEB9F|nr:MULTISPECIES: M1 family metallopeptidase [unclassified Duganella]SDH59081.1 Aminopeptidase N [Duganella sp. OV458]SDJ44177.1 Leukotriene A4 hydrolase, C-terminal [Duganella sp. OV510]
MIKKTISALVLSACMSLAAHADPLSYARYDQVRTTDLYLDLKADFSHKMLSGYAELTLNWIDKNARTLVLDTNELNISKVQVLNAAGRWTAVSFMLDRLDVEKGRALRIALPFQPQKVRVYYRTAPSATALQWMNPEQTMSGKRPFMFSQSEEINARSWAPVQDTPAVRFTYSARIEAPAGMRVVMSAENDQQATGAGGWKFKMTQPIPSYLLAIAIGEIDVRNVGPRSAVYAEPQRIDAAAAELVDTEKMIAAAEGLYGPYRWERYDMIVLPPSFPIGGMENPRMTFLTPTMIAGDRSLVDLIAHELAHSWSGNLVTNASWKHFWLNEGFTTYVTTRIVEKLYGEEVAEMNLQVEQNEAMASLAKIPLAKQALLTRDPDTSAASYTDSNLVYPKGAWLLRTLEQRAGRDVFDPFLRGWFDQHAFQSATTQEFVDYLKKNLLDAHPEIMSQSELDEWLYGPGIPATAKHAASPRLAALDAQRDAWLKGELPTAELPAKNWIALEWMHFLNGIDGKASAVQMQQLDQSFALGKTGNNEIAYRFLLSSVKAGYNVREPLNKFLMSVGRQKFVVPLYAALLKNPNDKDWAKSLYLKARTHYHPVTQASVDKAFKQK